MAGMSTLSQHDRAIRSSGLVKGHGRASRGVAVQAPFKPEGLRDRFGEGLCGKNVTCVFPGFAGLCPARRAAFNPRPVKVCPGVVLRRRILVFQAEAVGSAAEQSNALSTIIGSSPIRPVVVQPVSEPVKASSAHAPEDVRALKQCQKCLNSKPRNDFQKLATSVDGRHYLCRACLAAFKLIRLNKELHHMSLSVAESWERRQQCSLCGEVKELRDFGRNARYSSGVHSRCRACESEAMAARALKIPPDTPQQCSCCSINKPASDFSANKFNANGLERVCRMCRVDIERSRRKRKAATMFFYREWKVCLKCGRNKRAKEFSKSKANNDGLTPNCKECKNALAKRTREQAQDREES